MTDAMRVSLATKSDVDADADADSDRERERDANCHFVPCEIEYRGPASVEQLFTLDPSDESTASFRGRRMKGKEIILPEGYKGMILNEDGTITSECGKMMYWNWDKNPSANDAFSKITDWFKVSHSIHSCDD